MFSHIKSYILQYYTWLFLLVIFCFGAAAFYSCIQILQEEAAAIARYQEKISHLHDLEEKFGHLEQVIISHFDYVNNDKHEKKLAIISDSFSEFQNSFIFFNQFKQEYMPNSKEVRLIGSIQSNIMDLVPYIRQTTQERQKHLPRQVLIYMHRIQENLVEFGYQQVRREDKFLSAEVLSRRRQSIIISVSLLSFSSFLLLLFLVHKNNQLEAANQKNRETNDLSNQRMMAIEAASDGIGIMDAQYRLIYMNKALCALHGIDVKDKQDYIGLDWTSLYNQAGRDYIEANVYPHLAENQKWSGESPVMRKDGKVIEAELSLTLLPGGKGMIGTARDVSERRKAEQENQHLQAQIHQSQKMEAIGRLAGGMAHDFNNILAAIMGYGEFLSEDLHQQPKLKKFADNILMAGQKGRALIDQMLSFSRRKDSQMVIINLQDALSETISMISASLPKTIELNFDAYYDKPAYIKGDSSHIMQALMNIVVNAVDAMEDDRGSLQLSLSLIEPDEDTFDGMISDDFSVDDSMPLVMIEEVEPGHTILELGHLKKEQPYFQLSITDTGSGMSHTVMEHIFEPFFTTKSVDKGTGLGMANVHGALVSHHAALIIDSIILEGTTFDLFFPQVDHINDLNLLNTDQGKLDARDFSDVSLLLVDDQEEVIMMMQTLLNRAGCKCTAMVSSLEALALLKKNPHQFDVVITDQNMPKMTGLELIEQTAQFNEDLPFIIVSGYSTEKLQEIRYAFPAIKATLAKPIEKDAFLDALDKVLKNNMI